MTPTTDQAAERAAVVSYLRDCAAEHRYKSTNHVDPDIRRRYRVRAAELEVAASGVESGAHRRG